jgi:hypothetical protein
LRTIFGCLSALVEGATGFIDAAVSEAFAEFEGGGEALAGELAFAKAQVGDAAKVETVGLSPGVLAVRCFRKIEGLAGVLEGFMGVARREVGLGEGEAEVDGVFSEAASVGEEDASFGFGDGLGMIAEVALEFAGGVEAPELEFDLTREAGEGAGVLKMSGGLGRVAGK